jgi:hypothetical protein
MSAMCRRRCHRGCGCWARAGRRRTTPMTPAPSLSPRLAHHRWLRCAVRITCRCCACWPRRSSMRAELAAVPAAVCTPSCVSWCRAGSARKSLPHKQTRSSPGDLVFVAVNRDSCVGRLVRVDPDRDRHECSSKFNGWVAAEGTPDEIGQRLFRATPRHGSDRSTLRSITNPTSRQQALRESTDQNRRR